MEDPSVKVEPDTSAKTSVAEDAEEVTVDLPIEIKADFSPVTDHDPFQQGRIRVSETTHYDSRQAQAAFDRAVQAANEGYEEAAVENYLLASNLAESAREWYIAAVACQRVGDFLRTPKPPCDLERAFRMYRRAVGAYRNCGLFAEARELSYRLMCLKLRRSRDLQLPWWQRLELLAFWAIAGFGHRPLRVVASAAVFVLLYALIYWSIGGIVESSDKGIVSFQHAIYFSGTTFSTVGYGDFIPAPHAQLIALTEAALGSFTMGLFVAVLAQRLKE